MVFKPRVQHEKICKKWKLWHVDIINENSFRNCENYQTMSGRWLHFQINMQSEDLLVSIGLLFSLYTVNLLRCWCVVRKSNSQFWAMQFHPLLWYGGKHSYFVSVLHCLYIYVGGLRSTLPAFEFSFCSVIWTL